MIVSGYSSITSVRPGSSIRFHLKGDSAGSVTLNIKRIGDLSTHSNFTARLEANGPLTDNAWEGFDWPVTKTFRVPTRWPSGFYTLNHGTDTVLSFVVRARAPGSTSSILFQISFLTPAAYNSAGGKSFYFPFDNTQRARKVSLLRPGSSPRTRHDRNPELIREAKLVEWLQEEGIAIECCSSIDLHSTPNLLEHYDCLVIGYHDEYWTKPMRDHCETFIADGGNMIILSGNTCYRQVRLEDHNRLLVFYKFPELDTETPHLEQTAIAWAEPPVNRPQNTLLGVGWTEGAFGRGDSGAYSIRFPDHWVFEQVTTRHLARFLNYETDAADYIEEPEGYPRVSGAENTPLSATLLATADLRHWGGKPGRATMSLYSRNGSVFNAATTEWLDRVRYDPVVTQITRNVFERLQSRIPRDWELIGHASTGKAMAALNGKLFLASSDNRLWRRHPVGADVPWKHIGHANHVIAMTATGDSLFCVDRGNRLWWRHAIEADVGWTSIGYGGEGGGQSTRRSRRDALRY
ncbi:MAG: hypothetical protein KAH20_16825 [Methylococcales bacterium]|nr:hypothetical protein [Methylococcales bacterium]